ncbi:MAG: cysteine synthase family protein [Chthonomonadales bacterium]|nr:cysteine synthase family protein [Chthonomonadales bacterium]
MMLAPRRVAPESVIDLIGSTDLVPIRRIVPGNPRVRILAKAEWQNPGGSVKDRPALAMVRDGERSGALTPDRTILDATSGNTGVAYAMIGAALGYRVRICLPLNASEERKRMLRAYDADLVLTDPRLSSDGAILRAREIYAEAPERYFYPDQYSNPANWRAHFETTGPEIWEQTGAELTHFVAGLGTSGTMMGVGRFLRERAPRVRLIAFQPDSPFHGIEGLKHMATAMVPGIYDAALADEDLRVGTEEAHAMTRRIAREEGLLVGISSGAGLAAALRVAEGLDEGVIVVMFCDNGDRYLSDRFWEENRGDPVI